MVWWFDATNKIDILQQFQQLLLKYVVALFYKMEPYFLALLNSNENSTSAATSTITNKMQPVQPPKPFFISDFRLLHYCSLLLPYTLIVGVKKSYTYTCFPQSNFFPSLLRYPKFHKLGFWILCLQCPHRYDNFRIRVFIWPMNHEQQCNVQHSMQNVHKILAVQISQVCFRVSELVEFQS